MARPPRKPGGDTPRNGSDRPGTSRPRSTGGGKPTGGKPAGGSFAGGKSGAARSAEGKPRYGQRLDRNAPQGGKRPGERGSEHGSQRRGEARHGQGHGQDRTDRYHPARRPGAPRPAPQPSANPLRADGREGERIAKVLARAGVASRREVERMIEEGRVKIGEETVSSPATLLTNLRGVTVDGNPVAAAEATRLFAFHKPQGLLTAERDPRGRPTIYTALRNALPAGTPRLMPVGRLDFNTEGLLLLTNDGEFKRLLELPATKVERTYRARAFGDITQARLEELIEGIEIEGVRYGKIDANLERSAGRNRWIELKLTEGKNREVRRVLEHLGLEVSRLIRTAYGPFQLLDLPRGGAVEIDPRALERFRRSLGVA